jgi:hypothetical protein
MTENVFVTPVDTKQLPVPGEIKEAVILVPVYFIGFPAFSG